MKTTAVMMALLWGTALLLLVGGVSASDEKGSDLKIVEPEKFDDKSCEKVRQLCAFDANCAMAMHNFLTMCEKVLTTNTTTCPDLCLHGLIRLTSTESGKRLLNCECKELQCENLKKRLEVCRPLVLAVTQNETVVSCDVAQWLCEADQVCRTAFNYYNTFCKKMMKGEECTERCMNSMQILQRQEKAAKMYRCRCTGAYTVSCLQNKERMVRLCYNGGSDYNLDEEEQEQQQHHGGNKSGGGVKKSRRKHRPRMFDLDPDRAEVEMMLANPKYKPDGRHRYDATAGGGVVSGSDGDSGSDTGNDFGVGSAFSSRARIDAVLCALIAAVAALLVTRS